MQRQIGASLNLKMAGLQEPVSSLSGGNAQKVVIGKWLMRKPQLLLLDDPTKGVDVGTKAEFYALVTNLCEKAKQFCFTAVMMRNWSACVTGSWCCMMARSAPNLSGATLTKENLIAASLGVVNGGVQ